MDSFEAIRQSADDYHIKLVSGGANPLRPIELVAAAVDDLDLELIWLPLDDPLLKGGRALFDEQSGTICAVDSGSDDERALLVAHEIGHAQLHVGSNTCTHEDIDPSRSSEAAPVGLQRIEDYGVRERKELQANVFAREFLLPRQLARRLYIDDAATTASISSRTGLPIALVQQQVLDALLVPTFSAKPEVKTAEVIVPDDAQRRGIIHRASPFQLQAGPGTGKTRTLINRIESLITEGIQPDSILVLTFSNRAAAEISERLNATVPEATPRIWMGTFHAFGLDIVRRYHDRFGLSPSPVLFDRSDAIVLMEEMLPTLPLVHYRNLWDPVIVLKDVLNAISRAKDELVDQPSYETLARTMRENAATEDEIKAAEKCLEISEIYRCYETIKQEKGGVDFGDLVMLPARLLEENDDIRTAIQLRHRHTLVDEYQDVNRASVRLVRALAGDGKRLWVVGDSRQSVYRFRGASSANMAAYEQDFPGAKIDQLEINYRSRQEIVVAFVGFSPHMGASENMLPLALSAKRGSGGSVPEIKSFDTLGEEEGGIAASIRELERDGVDLRDQAVLCRSNRRLNEIATALELRGIPVLHLGNLFERPEVRDLLAGLSLAVDPFGAGMVRLAAMDRYKIPLDDIGIALEYVAKSESAPLRNLSGIAGISGLSPEGRQGFEAVASDFGGMSGISSPWKFLTTYLLDRTDLARELHRNGDEAGQLKALAVWQFLNFVRDQPALSAGHPIQRLLERIRQLVLLAEERDLRQVPTPALQMNAVRLMTVHASKGLEFEAVHLPGMTKGSFPSRRQGQRCPPPVGMITGGEGLSVREEATRAHIHEEECLFFVAASRAKTHLRLYKARRQPNGNNIAPSPFLDQLPSERVLVDDQPDGIDLPPGTGELPSINVHREVMSAVTDAQLISYDGCPRRFFYTHVLGLRGARKSTAFSRTHDCVYGVIHWLAKARESGEPDHDAAHSAFSEIWDQKGPTDQPYAADYKALAEKIVRALVNAGAGRRYRKNEPLAINFDTGQVYVQPSEIAELSDGTVVIRRVRTGAKRSDEYDRLDYALYQMAAEQNFGPGARVEALHLSDEVSEDVTITKRKMDSRRAKAASLLSKAVAGEFPIDPDTMTCARCPHFFICAATPIGPITLS